MNSAAVQAWAWILLYTGMLTLVLGLFSRAADPALGLGLMVSGGLGVLAGIGLIVWRSRMPGDAALGQGRPHDRRDDAL